MSAAERAITHSPLISYPQKAAFGRVLPKNKIYEHSGANTRLKDLFVEQVEQIVWQYKLAPETINLPARASVPEVQIFSIQLKANDLHQDVLRCIDTAVQFPLLFELHRGQGEQAQTQVVGAYKRRSEADASRWVLSSYFASDWLPAATPRALLPLALDMAALYEALLCRLIPLAHRSGESLADLIARAEQVEAKRREVEKTASRLAKEKQFNRKVEINSTLRKLKAELLQLSAPNSIEILKPTSNQFKENSMNVNFFTQGIKESFLEVEVRPNRSKSFEADYFSLTGEMPVIGVGYQHQENKWGIECRIYFNSESDLNDQFAAMGIDVEQDARPYKNEWKFRVNNKDFFWALIRSGYRLGKN